MIKLNVGNLVDVTDGILVHGVNAQGKMNSGVAKDIRARFPKAYLEYMDAYKANGLALGDVIYYRSNDNLVIANAVTQKYYGFDGKKYVDYKAVEKCFTKINKYALDNGYSKVSFPMIGCGLGGGAWGDVSQIIDSILDASIEKNLWVLEATDLE